MSRVLQPDQIDAIRRRYEAGETIRSLGPEYGVHSGTIWLAVRPRRNAVADLARRRVSSGSANCWCLHREARHRDGRCLDCRPPVRVDHPHRTLDTMRPPTSAGQRRRAERGLTVAPLGNPRP